MSLRPEETQALFSLISIMVSQENETARLYFQQDAEYQNLRRTLWISVLLGLISSIAAVTAAIIAARASR
jgi:ABC-type Fe3+ transport system permease subunit